MDEEQQYIVIQNNDYSELEELFEKLGYKKILLVCGRSLERLEIGKYLDDLENRGIVQLVRFHDFQPNPKYESVIKGIEVLQAEDCEAILAVGGGSAMDVAKCIKLFSNMDKDKNYLEQTIVPNDLPLIAVPTTSGTGSESTRFAVIYYNGEKQSVSDYSCIPSMMIFDASTLSTLPEYQRKVTMLDAFCHAIESFWSVNSTEESKDYSKTAIQMILKNMDSYLANEDIGNREMLKASNIAGKAINITQTTAGHAMCYKLTSLYGLSHGHAAALCVATLWKYMLEHLELCIDSRGTAYLQKTFQELTEAFGFEKSDDALEKFEKLLSDFELEIPKATDKEFDILKKSVNPVRLKNHPIQLDEDTIDMLYQEILQH